MERSKEKHITIQDLGISHREEEDFENWLGIYNIYSSFDMEASYITAQGLLEIAAYAEQHRAKLEQEATRSLISLPEDRYYVEQVSETEYQVRERLEVGQSKPNDPVIRLFGNQIFENNRRYRAYAFAGHLNIYQRQLDERYGYWVRHAAVTDRSEHELQHHDQVQLLLDLKPFRFRWYFPSLGLYRSCGKTYCEIPYENLPPLPEDLFLGTVHWLPPLEKDTDLRGMDHYYSETDLRYLITTAQDLKITLPSAFLRCMHSPELLGRIPSCTDCYFDLSMNVMAYPGNEEGYLIRFLIDRQGIIAWYLYLTPRGKQFVLAGTPWLDYQNTSKTVGLMQTESAEKEQPKTTMESMLDVCALSFESFLYRFWIENMIWYKIVHYKGENLLNEEEKRYVQYYRSVQP